MDEAAAVIDKTAQELDETTAPADLETREHTTCLPISRR